MRRCFRRARRDGDEALTRDHANSARGGFREAPIFNERLLPFQLYMRAETEDESSWCVMFFFAFRNGCDRGSGFVMN